MASWMLLSLSAGPTPPMQKTLLNSNLKLMSFAQADALVQKFPSLSKVIFPRASTSIVNDLPQADVTLLAATALLVSKDTLHPALVYLLLDAAKTVARRRRLLHAARHVSQPEHRGISHLRRKHALLQIRPPFPAALPSVLAGQLCRTAIADSGAVHGRADRFAAGVAAHGRGADQKPARRLVSGDQIAGR